MRPLIVTYSHAYVGGETSLCAACVDDRRVLEALPALGPVQHGRRRADCDGCVMRRPDSKVRS